MTFFGLNFAVQLLLVFFGNYLTQKKLIPVKKFDTRIIYIYINNIIKEKILLSLIKFRCKDGWPIRSDRDPDRIGIMKKNT